MSSAFWTPHMGSGKGFLLVSEHVSIFSWDSMSC